MNDMYMKVTKIFVFTLAVCLSFSASANEDRLGFQLDGIDLLENTWGSGEAKLKVFMVSESYGGEKGKLSIPADKVLLTNSNSHRDLSNYPGLYIPIEAQRPVQVYLIAINEESNSLVASVAIDLISRAAQTQSVKFFKGFKVTGWGWFAGVAVGLATQKTLEAAVEYLEKNEIGRAIVRADRFSWNNDKVSILSSNGAVKFHYSTRMTNESTPQPPSSKSIISGDFTINNNGTVTDRSNNIMWMTCSMGQQWNQDKCTGSPILLNYDEAQEKNGFNFAGYSNWEVPSLNQLKSLIKCGNGVSAQEALDHTCLGSPRRKAKHSRPTIDKLAFPSTHQSWYWARSNNSRFGGLGVNFVNGGLGEHGATNRLAVRLVRKLDN